MAAMRVMLAAACVLLAASVVEAGAELKGCPNNCNGHGTCADDECRCDKGWTYYDCSATICKKGECVDAADRRAVISTVSDV